MAKVTFVKYQWITLVKTRPRKGTYEEAADNATEKDDMPMLLDNVMRDHLDGPRLERVLAQSLGGIREDTSEEDGTD